MAVRNPLAGLALTILTASVLAFLAAFPLLYLPDRLLVFFYLPFVLFGVGVLAGRASYIGMMGFVGATIGAFVAVYVFRILFLPWAWPFWPAGLEILLDLGFASLCGLGGFAMGKLGLRRLERIAETAPKSRRCRRCGAKVGVAARKCWSCKGYLPPT